MPGRAQESGLLVLFLALPLTSSNIWGKIRLSRETNLASGSSWFGGRTNPCLIQHVECHGWAVLDSTKGFSNSEEFEAGRLNDSPKDPRQLSGKAHA